MQYSTLNAMIAENFAVELITFFESVLRGGDYKETDAWKERLKSKLKVLVSQYWKGAISTQEALEPPTPSEAGLEQPGDDSSIAESDEPRPLTLQCDQNLRDNQEQNLNTTTSSSSLLPNSELKVPSHDYNALNGGEPSQFDHRELDKLDDTLEAVERRRQFLVDFCSIKETAISKLPYLDYNYDEVKGTCCENVIGYIPLPAGFAGPLNFEGLMVPIPMSTTEGALIASVSRGCKAINDSIKKGQQLSVVITADGMTRAPVLEFEDLLEAIECEEWVSENFKQLKAEFEKNSRFLRLTGIETKLCSTYLYLRFVATTGDAMGMNMVTKATWNCLKLIQRKFSKKIKLMCISGNMCVDKKQSATNWLKGRGKSAIAQAIIPAETVSSIFKTTVDNMVELAEAKLMLGTSTSITIGGWNAHAANVVAAIFLATGQDAAQVVSSAMCMTHLKKCADGALRITCTMPCLEVGTVGGGTILTPQRAALEMLGCCDPERFLRKPGENAKRLARLICAAVLAGELSLLAAQCNKGELVESHMRLNRSNANLLAMSHIYQQSPPAHPSLRPSAIAGHSHSNTSDNDELSNYGKKREKTTRSVGFNSQIEDLIKDFPKNLSKNHPCNLV